MRRETVLSACTKVRIAHVPAPFCIQNQATQHGCDCACHVSKWGPTKRSALHAQQRSQLRAKTGGLQESQHGYLMTHEVALFKIPKWGCAFIQSFPSHVNRSPACKETIDYKGMSAVSMKPCCLSQCLVEDLWQRKCTIL